MIPTDKLKAMRNRCIGDIDLKVKAAKKGHDHIVNSQSIDNFTLLEMTSELLNFRKKFGDFEGIET